MACSAQMKGPAARTVVLVFPQICAPTPTEAGPVSFAGASSVTAPSNVPTSAYGGSMMGAQLPKFLDIDCMESLLGYARLLFAQPQGGKLSVLGAGNQMRTITSWDPGQQSLDAVIKGFSQWKIPEKDAAAPDVELAINEAVQMLFQPQGVYMEDDKALPKGSAAGSLQDLSSAVSKLSVSELWKVALMARTRLIVLMLPNCGAGGSADLYHKLVLDALGKIDKRSSNVECCDALFLDACLSDKHSNSCVCMQGSDSDILLSTSFYKIHPACTVDLLLDLAYLHHELSAIAVKGLASTALKNPVEKGSAGVTGGIKREDDEGSFEMNLSSDTDLRLVLCQTSPISLSGVCCFTPNGGELRKSRTTFLLRLKKAIPKGQLLALPCASVTPLLLEIPLPKAAAQLWETFKSEEVDSEGYIVLALSAERDLASITHVLVWRLERFWLHTLTPRDTVDIQAPDVSKGDVHFKSEESADEKIAGRFKGTPLFAPDGMVASLPGRIADMPLLPRKRGCEDIEDPSNQPCCSSNSGTREKKPKQQERSSNRCYPVATSETVIGGPDRHSATLAALLAPIRSVFLSDDPANELVNTATSYVGRLLELTGKNDGSLFPHAADIPVARRELYKKMWWELKRLAKRTRKDKTQGQEDLAQAIRAARADFKTSEQQIPQPLPALTEKPPEHVHINKRRRCEEVPRDVYGRPVFPIKLGPSLQVYDLGNVVWNRPAFHSEKYIWPAGYKSRRAYASMLNSENRIFYWCEIVDDGQAPEFRLTPEDDENNPVIGISATAVWTVVVKRVGALRLEEGGKKTFANVSGPEYFGFANPTIARLIQKLPNSEKCAKYKHQDYFPNVPMRATELDAWQGIIANECASSPPRKDSGTEGKDIAQLRSPPGVEHGGDPEIAEAGERVDQSAIQVSDEDDSDMQKQNSGVEESELRGMSWDSEAFRKASARRGNLGLAEFSKRFLLSNSGSLFSYYWSAKLKRAAEVVELDGRK